MSYFLAIRSFDRIKVFSRVVYPTKREAIQATFGSPKILVMDADHEPGRTILNSIGPQT